MQSKIVRHTASRSKAYGQENAQAHERNLCPSLDPEPFVRL